MRAVSQYTERDVGWRIEEKEDRREWKELMGEVWRLGEVFREMAESERVVLPLEGYVLDVHALKKEGRWVVERIDLNGFGAQMSAGSGLFSWLTD